MEIIQKATTNFWAGRKGYGPIAFVIHIMEGSLSGTDAWFANPASQVSSHFGIGKAGEVHQYVKIEDSAWHAGVVKNPTWKLIKKSLLGATINPNYYTIGIECEGRAGDVWHEEQMASICEVIKQFRGDIIISRDTVVSHNEIASYKEDMSLWIEEILKRINGAKAETPLESKIAEAIRLISQALETLKGVAIA